MEGDTLGREIHWGGIYSEEGDILGREIYLAQVYYDGVIYDLSIYFILYLYNHDIV